MTECQLELNFDGESPYAHRAMHPAPELPDRDADASCHLAFRPPGRRAQARGGSPRYSRDVCSRRFQEEMGFELREAVAA